MTFEEIIILFAIAGLAVVLPLQWMIMRRFGPWALRGLIIPLVMTLAFVGAGTVVAWQVDPPTPSAEVNSCRERG